MSAYSVLVSVPSGHQWSIPAPTLSAAIAVYREEIAKPGVRSVRVFGEGMDVDCDSEGYFLAHDGLTDRERERVEEAEGRAS